MRVGARWEIVSRQGQWAVVFTSHEGQTTDCGTTKGRLPEVRNWIQEQMRPGDTVFQGNVLLFQMQAQPQEQQ